MSADMFLGESVLCELRIFTATIITNSLFVYVTSTAAHQDQHLINNLLRRVIPFGYHSGLTPLALPNISKLQDTKCQTKPRLERKAHFLCLHIYPIPTVNTRLVWSIELLLLL